VFILVQNELEMKKTVRALRATAAATTVTACLFRWSRVRTFAAWDKWLESTAASRKSSITASSSGSGATAGVLQKISNIEKLGAAATSVYNCITAYSVVVCILR
jgi:hypothetical protein